MTSPIIASAVRHGSRALLVIQKHSPEILTTVGVVGFVAAGVLASRATLKLEDVMDDIKEEREEIKEKLQVGDIDDREYAKAIINNGSKGVGKLVRLYGPSAAIAFGSGACVISALGIMKTRYSALSTAYVLVDQAYKEYQARVLDVVGEEKSTEIQLKEYNVTSEDGKVEKRQPNPRFGVSPYRRFFDETSSVWSRTPEYNLVFLNAQQNYANDLLHARGHLFLNEVYDMLGIPRSKAGVVVGWVISEDSDNFVDFGIYDTTNPNARMFVNGDEPGILLDFNVDGVIYDRIRHGGYGDI